MKGKCNFRVFLVYLQYIFKVVYILEIAAICYNDNLDKMYTLFGILFSFLKSYWYNICDM